MTGISRRGFATFLLSGTAALAALWPAVASAQQADSAIVLDQVVVEGEGQDGSATGPVKGYVAKRTLTGSKTNTPIEEIPQSVSVIGREEIDDQGAQKADEALRYTAGVFSQPFGPDSDTNWIFIRGFQATQTGIYQDGLQQFSEGFGGFFVDTYNLERIEVLRGAASVLYGGSNPGGLINYVSKRPTGERLRNIETGINDAGTGYIGFDIGDKASDVVDYRVSGRIAGGNGYTDFAEGFRGSVSPSLTWKPDEQTSLTLLSNFTYIDEVHNGGAFLPYTGTVVDAPFGKIDRDANFTEPDLDSYLRKQASIGYEFEHTFDNDWTVRQNARFGYSDVREHSLYAFGYNGFSPVPTDPDNLLSRINFAHHTKVASFLVDNQLQGKVETGAVEHTLLFGVDYKYFGMDQVQASIGGTPISANNPVYGAPQSDPVPYIDQELKQHQVGFYLQDQLRFGDGWLVTLNGRYDYVSTDARGTPAYKGHEGEFSGRAGLAYEFDNGLIPYASVSTFFNPLFGSSPVAGFYKPETGTQYEVGVKYAPTWFDGLFTVALFDLTKENVVTGPFLAETQLGAVNSRGIELEAKANITDNLKATAAFTAFDLKIKKDVPTTPGAPDLVGKTPFIVPEQQASLSLDYTFDQGTALEGFSVGGGVRYIGSSWADNENTKKVPSATVFDAKLGYKKDNWGVDLNVTNLFDKAYVASCQTEFSCGYAEGRSFKLKANVSW